MDRVIVWHRWSPPADSSREAAAIATLWRIAARDRFAKLEAEVLLELGGTIVLAVEPAQLVRAVETCVSTIRDVERDEAGAGVVACGIAVGSIERTQAASAYVGDALDRAQALANAAGPHEVVLDGAAQAATGGVFLCARELTYGVGLSAAVLDRAFARKSDCQRALAKLRRPSFLGHSQSQLESLRRLARSSGRHRVVLVGPHGIGISHWVATVAQEVAPPAWLDVRPVGASIAPLSGLMYALRRLPEGATPEQLLGRDDEPDQHARDTLIAIRAGLAVSRRDAVLSLRQYIGRASEDGRRALISVDPAPLIDPSTVGVVAEAARENGPDVLVLMRLLLESRPPEAFARGGGLSEIRVRGLSQAEARALASSMLGLESPNDMARRAAAMGGANPQAVAEAVRVLVASGDVVFDQGAFRWRRGPAGRLNAMTLETLLEERIDALTGPFRRALEVLATVPDPDDRALAAEVAARDGLLPETWERAVEELDVLGLVHANARGLCLSPVVRTVAQSTIAPARSLELNRAVAQSIASHSGSDHGFARATLAYFLARSGRMHEAAELFLEVAELAGQLGFVRSGVRLAAAAVECNPTDRTRGRAAQIAERLSERAPPRPNSGTIPAPSKEQSAVAITTSTPTSGLGSEARSRAVEAILARDFDAFERAIELLVAAGRGGPSIERLRTVTLLAKGDHAGAAALLERLREGQPLRESPRLTLTAALVAIATGKHELAVRSSLAALARTREARDAQGERAALSVLALCFRRLGREADAVRLARAALDTSAATQ